MAIKYFNVVNGISAGNIILNAANSTIATSNIEVANSATRGSFTLNGLIYQANTAPSNPQPGDQWYNTANGILFEYLNDGATSQWVDISSVPLPNIGSATTAQTVTNAAQPNITSVGTLTGLVMGGNITPSTSNTYTLGNSTHRWLDLYLAGNTIYLGDSVISTEANTLTFTNGNGGSFEVGGNSTVTTILNGNSNISVIANGNVTTSVNGTANVMVVTKTGVNVAGTLNATGNANVGNIGAATAVLTTGNITTINSGLMQNGNSNVTITANGNVTISAVGGARFTATSTGANITGTLGVSGNANVGNIGATNGVFTNVSGNGNSLSSLQAANITGTLSNAVTNSITNVGTITSGTWNSTFTAGLNANTLANIQGGNVSGAVAFATTANAVAGANVSGTVANATNAGAVLANFTSTAATTYLAGIGIGSNGYTSLSAVTGIQANLAQNSITATTFFGSLSGAATTAGTVTTAAQPNITSVGTLTSLTVSGNASANNISATNKITAGNGLQVTTGSLSVLAGNLDVTGNINVTGNLNYSNVTDLVVGDPLIYIGANNTGDTVDLGVVGSYNNGTYYHTGIARNAANDTWTFFDGVVAEPTTVIDWANATYPTVKLGGLVATSNANIGGIANITGNAIVGGTLSVTGNANVGNIGATNFVGSGASLTSINASNISSGTLAQARLANSSLTVNGTSISLGGSGTITANTTQTLTLGSYLTGTSFNGGTAVTATVDATTTSTASKIVARDANANIYANNAIFTAVTGNGSGLSAIAGANVTGTVANATYATSAGSATTATRAGTVTTNAQPNITSVGTLSALTVSGGAINTDGNVNITFNNAGFYGNGVGLTNIPGANVTGTVASATSATTATRAGTVTTNAQPNITSVGTLSALTVSGGAINTDGNVNITFNNAGFYGNGVGLTNIPGANVTGTVGNATVAVRAGTVTTNAQPNITSVGTLTGLTIGNATANSVFGNGTITLNSGLITGNGAGLSAIAGANVTGTVANATYATSAGSATTATSATTAGTVTTAAQPNITSVGTLTSLSVTGAVTADTFRSSNNGGGTNFKVGDDAWIGDVNTADTISIRGQQNAANGYIVFGNADSTTKLGRSGSGALTYNATFNPTTLQTTAITAGANTTAGTVTGNWTLTAGSRWQSTYADLAERYQADNNYEPGTVVVLGGEHEVTVEDVADSHKVAGVVTTNPAYIMNLALEGENVVEVALIGRVPCKVVGTVSKGDLLTTASVAGHAHANNDAAPGRIIGKALENFSGSQGIIEIMVGRT